jgi:AcrR family transcriptional regulator
MSKPKTDLAPRIREKTLELLLEQEPEEISTREIAKACGVTATSIYYYYEDREALFNEVKLDCLKKMEKFIFEQLEKEIIKYNKKGKNCDLLTKLKFGFEIFRDWAFSNPRIALLVMARIKADTKEDTEKINKYYQTTVFTKELLNEAVKNGLINSKDTLLDASLCIAALWGSIEAVLLNRIVPQYWSKRKGVEFTDKMIDLILASLTQKNRHK